MVLSEGKTDFYYLDPILSYDMTPEEREADLKRLKEESDKLTDWPPM
jgi:hypothetical protein